MEQTIVQLQIRLKVAEADEYMHTHLLNVAMHISNYYTALLILSFTFYS